MRSDEPESEFGGPWSAPAAFVCGVARVGYAVAIALGLPIGLSAQPTRRAWLPDVSAGIHATRSTFRGPYRGEYRTDLAPMVSVMAYQGLGSGFAAGLGLQYVNQRVTGLGPVLRYRLEYLEVPLTLTRSIGWIGRIATEIHGGGVMGVPLRCTAVSAVPGGAQAQAACGDPPIGVEDHRMEASLRLGGSARIRVGPTWLALTGGLQYGIRDVFGNARVTTLLLGVEIGR